MATELTAVQRAKVLLPGWVAKLTVKGFDDNRSAL